MEFLCQEKIKKILSIVLSVYGIDYIDFDYVDYIISCRLNMPENRLDMVFDFFIHAFRLILVLNLLPLLFPLAEQGD